jgi:hypothetical protein
MKTYYSKVQIQRLEEGVCLLCAGQLATKLYCRPCADKKTAAVDKFKANNPERRKEQLQNYKLKKRLIGCEACGNTLATARYCRECADKESNRVKKYYQANKEKVIARIRQWYRANYVPKKRSAKYKVNSNEVGIKAPIVKIPEFYPYSINPDNEGFDLIERINALVPKNILEDLRADICQELALLVYSGEVEEAFIAETIPKVIKQQRKFMPTKFTVSIDALDDWQAQRLESKLIQKQ